jgi:FlaA1/EpsC-like NDP-sugar epimerase
MVSILTHCHDAEVSCKTVPGLDELINRSHLLGQIRDVAVEDLLGRSPVTLDDSSVRADIEGRVVLITGAAGSIGREICRQVCRFNPAEVIAFDISEGGIFELQREIGSRFPRLGFRAEIGSIRSRRRLERLFQRYRPAVVFHAAAYKHVPLMEEHVCEAVQNNVLGTFNLALAAANAGTDQFLMISTDKAVRPSSVMGLTKRVAEMVIESMRHTETRFAAVRFGNVLGSSGSVVPLFKQQISCGGPVQVTHPEMRRYFMTIPEAVQLVLQASSMGTEATFVLDMGEPVRIVDLAKNLIVLSGLRPGVDIQIEFSGIRQGEKLNEELSDAHESLRPTRHKQISVIEPSGYAPPIAPEFLERIRDLCEQGDETAVILCLKELVPEYSVSASVLRRLAQPTELARHLKESESRTLQLETSAGA